MGFISGSFAATQKIIGRNIQYIGDADKHSQGRLTVAAFVVAVRPQADLKLCGHLLCGKTSGMTDLV